MFSSYIHILDAAHWYCIPSQNINTWGLKIILTLFLKQLLLPLTKDLVSLWSVVWITFKWNIEYCSQSTTFFHIFCLYFIWEQKVADFDKALLMISWMHWYFLFLQWHDARMLEKGKKIRAKNCNISGFIVVKTSRGKIFGLWQFLSK